jgi:hypothetical protein
MLSDLFIPFSNLMFSNLFPPFQCAIIALMIFLIVHYFASQIACDRFTERYRSIVAHDWALVQAGHKRLLGNICAVYCASRGVSGRCVFVYQGDNLKRRADQRHHNSA